MSVCRYKLPLCYLIVFPIVGLFFINTASSQSLQFKNYTAKDGLPSSEVYSVMQDSKGYMWFSTDRGVSRFNGYEFETFTKSNGLADNTIFESIEDYKGRIWFRSFSGKLSYFYNDSIYRVPLNDSLSLLLAHARTGSIAVDSSDNLYLSTYSLPYIIRINLRNNYQVSFLPLHNNLIYIAILPKSNFLINGIVNSIYESTDSLTVYSIMQNVPTTIKRHTFKWDPWKKPGGRLHDKAIKLPGGKIATSQYSRFMVLHDDSMLFSFNLNSLILNITPDKSGGVWIVLETGEPLYYNNGEIIHLPILVSLKDKHTTCVTRDLEGGLWFTTLTNGVYYLPSLDFKLVNKENGLQGNKVNFVTATPDKKIWLIVDGKKINTIDNDLIKYRQLKNIPEGSYIKDILFHSDGTVWVSGDIFGISIFSDQYSLTPLASINPGLEYNMIEEDDGDVWAVSINRLREFKRSGKVISMNEKKLFPERLFTICKGDEQKIWIGSIHGLVEYQNDRTTYVGDKYPLLKNRIDDIKKSPDGNLYIATRDTGIVIKTKNSVLHITTKEGLISNFCECICVDYKNNIWVGTNKGLSHIFIQTDGTGNCHIDSIRSINSSVLDEVNQIACINNTVYVATNNGLASFDMDKITTDHTPPPHLYNRNTGK
jgi:ligand-binding sensor domain-containing protein